MNKDRPPTGWPDSVLGISQEGLALFGINEKTGKLYWDGKEVVTRNTFRLDTFERWLASITLICVVVSASINVINFIGDIRGWWD
jgi:hypothetical protein